MREELSVGIDIGGTNTIIGLVDTDGHIVQSVTLSTQQYGSDYKAYVLELARNIRTLIGRVNPDADVIGVGVGVPNGNYFTGCVDNAVNLPWSGSVPLAADLSREVDLPVVVNNDANAAAIGEMIYGVAVGMRNFIEITLGTGVGSGIVVDGRLIYGENGNAGELGHICVVPDGRSCGCGRKGCLETYTSSRGVARGAVQMLQERAHTPSLLRQIPIDRITSKDVADAALSGDALALEVFDQAGTILGRALADFTCFSCPQAFILFGGLAQSGDLLMKPLKKAFDEHLLFVYKGQVQILFSTLPLGDAAVLGAAALACQERALRSSSFIDAR